MGPASRYDPQGRPARLGIASDRTRQMGTGVGMDSSPLREAMVKASVIVGRPGICCTYVGGHEAGCANVNYLPNFAELGDTNDDIVP